MTKTHFPLVASALALAALVPASASAQLSVIPANDTPLLTLSVSEEVNAAPDMATVSSGVQTRAPTAREAMAQNAAQMRKLVDAILGTGVERKYIRTNSVNLNAQYDYTPTQTGGQPRFIGYEASNMVSVEVRDLPKLGSIIDRMVDAGANNLNGPAFGIADTTDLMRQAREKALKSARERAMFYAQQSGYRTARLVSISESGGFMPMPRPMMYEVKATSAPPAPPTPIEPGQMATGVTLNVQYALER